MEGAISQLAAEITARILQGPTSPSREAR
jgi:hypothetical protein